MNLEWQKIEEENQDLVAKLRGLRDDVLPNEQGLRKALKTPRHSRRTRRVLQLIAVPITVITFALALFLNGDSFGGQPLMSSEEIAALDAEMAPIQAEKTIANGAAMDVELASFLGQSL